jgi:hypothetical protein
MVQIKCANSSTDIIPFHVDAEKKRSSWKIHVSNLTSIKTIFSSDTDPNDW